MTQPFPAPVPPAVRDILAADIAAPLLNTPVDEVLASLGIPPLPQIPVLPPLPGLPPLPALDPAALLQPITDLFGHLGSGNLSAMGPLDPTQVLSEAVAGFSAVTSLGSTVLGLLTSLEGQGAQAAAAKSAAAQTNTTQVSAQAAGIAALVGSAAAVVQAGNTELAAIAAQLAAELTVSAAPGGAAFAAAAAAGAAAEAAAVVAHVQAELAVLSTQMTVVGQPVPITSSPNAANTASETAAATKNTAATSTGMLDSQGADPLGTALQSVSQLGQLPSIGLPADQATMTLPWLTAVPVEAFTDNGRGHQFAAERPSAGVVVGLGATTPGSLQPAAVDEGPVPESFADVDARPDLEGQATLGADSSSDDAAASRAGAPMMPLGNPLSVGGIDLGDSEARGALVSARHGDELVGELDALATPVVGTVVRRTGPSEEALTL